MAFEEFTSLVNFRYRVVLSTLLQRPIVFKAQLQDHHLSFLRLVGKLCDGSTSQVTHDQCVFKPGLVTGGEIKFNCVKDCCWYLLPLLPLFLFLKKPLELNISGQTDGVCTLEIIKEHAIPFLKNYGANVDGVDFVFHSRGYFKGTTGSATLKWPLSATVKVLNPYIMSKCGKVIKIRGTTTGTKCPPATLNTIIGTSRKIFSEFIPDVYVYSIFSQGSHPGYLLSMIAHTTTELTYAACSVGQARVNPSDIANKCCENLFRTIKTSYLDPHLQIPALLLASCCEYTCTIMVKKQSRGTWQFIEDLERMTNKKVLINGEAPFEIKLSGIPLKNINREIK
eukprot:NODE_31_length_32452_cov_0.352672.p7 type:complete len:339 gc:universal NODE_31_length_32452_cov_0.352672:17147-18163(+)